MATQPREGSTTKDQQLKEAAEKSARSVFVGNIPYEASDEQLKDIFSQAGPVLSFRLVYDRETGKPKGFGFCEYKDAETAQSAMRNLNGTEIHGRQLRVDSAASQKGPDDPRAFMKEISPYGEAVNPTRAPETITNAVASLPPEQMFELMKQMKLCIQNNPEEARQMLLQNPQLAYALLQAQVVMKIVDPKVADAILHQPRGEPLPIGKLMEQAGIGPGSGPGNKPVPPRRPDIQPPQDMTPPGRGDIFRGDPRGPPQDFGRSIDRDARGPERDFRGAPLNDDRFRESSGPLPFDPRGSDRPPMERIPNDPRGMPNIDHRDPRMRPDDSRGPTRSDDRMLRNGPLQSRDPRGILPPDSRAGPMPPDMRGGPPPMHGRGDASYPPSSHAGPPPTHGPPQGGSYPDQRSQFPSDLGGLSVSSGSGGSGGPNEEEKQRLIMQVLSLTDAQINMLPEDQRESIRLLKAQFASSNIP